MINYISKPLVNEIIVNYMLEYDDENYNYDVISALRTVSEKINEVIPADVQPVKRGHWESSQYLWETGQTRCSNCMAEFYADDLMCISGNDKNIPDFCPCCGADMREEG